MEKIDWNWTRECRHLGIITDRFNLARIPLPLDRAIVWCRTNGETVTLTAHQVRAQVMQLAARLTEIGVRPGDRVGGVLGKRPESLTAALATWYVGAIYVPLFAGFSGEGLQVRLTDCTPIALITDRTNSGVLTEVADYLPEIGSIVVDAEAELFGDLDQPPTGYAPIDTSIADISTIMYTSGTTGKPKGCIMRHNLLANLLPYLRHHLAMKPSEAIYSTADAGWAFGLFTTGLAPMAIGHTRVIYEGGFDAHEWWRVLDRADASHFAAAPTAFRQLAAAGADGIPAAFTKASSAGEPLDSATFEWFRNNTGVEIYDAYGVSELGMLTGNLRSRTDLPPVAGSMGFELPGWSIELRDDTGQRVDGAGSGRLCVQQNGYFLSDGYWGRMPEWDARFDGEWFLTEDIVRRDEEGRFWFEARADDVIVASGMNVGPTEVEAALLMHPLVDDAGCVGIPDPLKGSIVTAHVVLNGPAPDNLESVLRHWVDDRVGRHAAPRKVIVWDELPRTASGKLRRVELRQHFTEETTA